MTRFLVEHLLRRVKRILLVENDPDQREALAIALRQAGYDVETAANGLEALEAMRRRRPCLVLLDMIMPVMSGWDFMVAVEREPGLAAVPTIILSATHAAMPRQVALGSAVLVGKPYDVDALIELVHRHCDRPAA